MATTPDFLKLSTAKPLSWGVAELGDTERGSFQLGPLVFHTLSHSNELWIAHHYTNEAEQSDGDQVPDWSRWALKKNQQSISLLPAFPDRSVVVKPDQPFRLVKGGKARVYIRVPVWCSVSLPKDLKNPLTQLPSVILSNTWFGDFVSGELCYWISSSARREVDYGSFPPHLVICPIQLRNSSDEELLVEKIRLQVGLLSIYGDEQSLWANETRITYEGSDTVSRVEATAGTPAEASAAKLLSAPRSSQRRNSGRTFGRLFDLPGLGFLSE